MIESCGPSSASSILKRANTSDDFPAPVLPTSPILSPAEMVRLIDFRTGSRSSLKENAFGQVLGEVVSDHLSCFSDYSRDQLEYWLPIGTNGVEIHGSLGKKTRVGRSWVQILVPEFYFSREIFIQVYLYDHLATNFADKTCVSSIMC